MGTFAADDVVAFDYGSYAHSILIFFRALIDTNHAAVRANEDFRASGDFGRQCESEIDLGSGREVVGEHEVNTACGNIPGVAAVQAGLSVYRQANIYRQRQIIPASQSTFHHPCCPSRLGVKHRIPQSFFSNHSSKVFRECRIRIEPRPSALPYPRALRVDPTQPLYQQR